MKITALDKLLNDTKFLEAVKRAALSHKDNPVPNNDGSLMQAHMWASGVVSVLKSRGLLDENDVEVWSLAARKKQGW